MSSSEEKMITFMSSRFGELSVPEESVIELPNGLIGFPTAHKFVMLEHKVPFSWFHSIEDDSLAFVVIDGGQFVEQFNLKVPTDDAVIKLESPDDCAVLVLATVRSRPEDTTANVKAPVFVNVKTRKGIQIIFDDPRLSTRFPLVTPAAEEDKASKKEDKKK